MARFAILDIIRCFAAFLVVFSHYSQAVKSPWASVDLGSLAVTIFVVLSGFCLTMTYKKPPFWSFFKSRLLRIYPTYLTCIAIVLVVFLCGRAFGMFSGIDGSPAVIACSIAGFCEPFGLQNLIPPAWFVCLIVSLYFLYPFIERGVSAKQFLSLVALFAISIFFRWLLFTPAALNPADWFPLCRVFEFGFGIFLARKIPTSWLLVLKPNRVLTFFAGISFAIFLLHYPLLSIVKLDFFGAYSTIAFIAALIILSALVVEFDNRFQKWAANPLAKANARQASF